MSQLTFDGREVPISMSSHGWRAGKSQRAVLDELGRRGSLTSTQAGVEVHLARGWCGSGARDDRYHSHYAGAGCCRYAATDGGSVLKGLAKRGIVVKISDLWFQP